MIESNKTETSRPISPVMSPENKTKEGKVSGLQRKKTQARGGDDDYNPYFYPPDLSIAEMHGRATLAGNSLNVYELNDEQFQEKNPKLYQELKQLKTNSCPCCGKDENGRMVSLFTRSVDLGRLGSALPGFFDFSKYLILSMLLSTLIFSIYTMINYSKQNWCGYETPDYSINKCGAKWKFYLSWASVNDYSIDVTERVLYIVAMVVMYGLKIIYFRRFRKFEAKIDDLITDITDYTVELRGLPQDVTKKDIIEFFKSKKIKNDQDEEVKINAQMINFVFKDSQKVLNKDNELKLKIGELVLAAKKNEANVNELEEKLKKNLAETKKMLDEEYFTNIETRKKNPNLVGSAYVSFETQIQKELVENTLAVKGFGKTIYKLFGGVRGPFAVFAIGRRHKLYPTMPGYFYVETAEAPSEIVFTNLGLSFLNRFFRKLFSLICSLILMAGTFVSIFLLKGAQSGLEHQGTKQTTNPYIVLITVVIKIACFILETVTPFLVEFERPETFTSRNIGMIWRSSISVFLNSALVVVLANIYYQRDDLDDTFYTDNGLANDLLFLLIFSCLEALFAVFIPGFVMTLYKRYKMKKDGQKSEVFQYQANEFHEGMPFIYPRRFGKYCNLILITFFQISIFPYAPLIGIVNIVLFLLADRYFLLRLSKVPEYCSNDLSLSMLRFSDMIFVAWSGGYMVFEIINNDEISNWTIATFTVALANLVFNPNLLLRSIFKYQTNEAENSSTTLKQLLTVPENGEAPDTYRGRNPVSVMTARLKVYLKPHYLERCKQNLKDLSIDSATENDSLQDIFKEEIAKQDLMEINNADNLQSEEVNESIHHMPGTSINYVPNKVIDKVHKPKDEDVPLALNDHVQIQLKDIPEKTPLK